MKDQQRVKLENMAAAIAVSDAMQQKALEIVNKKLGKVVYGYGELEAIAQDAVSEVTEKFFRIIKRGNTLLKDPEPLLMPLDQNATTKHPLAYYLTKGVTRFCDSRLRRWSNENEAKAFGARARVVIDNHKDSEDDFWDQHVSHSFDFAAVDAEKLDGLLQAKGLKDKDIHYMKLRLAGITFEEMSQSDGGSPDKYRKVISRAVEKAGLPDLKDL
ncbi:hypothetical protein [Amphritea pacifica]|uniref:Uncharacterized protein n=1 Tax=Amphritea pacifica TaxID=2811233 RepID=A0ABS2WCD7_9GAMM|nr:hypothetical protein [Amphritea pacifica]MBN0989363.1 hypothetical protein [Amphritea pacifica]